MYIGFSNDREVCKKVEDPYLESKIICFASTLPLYYYCDADGKTEFLTKLPSFRYDKVMIENLMEQEFPSFSPVAGTANVTINSTDFEKFILHYNDRIEKLAEVTNSTFAEAAYKYAEYLEEKKIFIQPVGWEAVTHRFINVGYLIQNGLYTFSSTATAHLKGYTGSAYLAANPAVSLTTIFVGGVFFASCERYFNGTILHTPIIIARDLCLLPTRMFELITNEMLLLPINKKFGVNISFNVTSYLKYGPGIKIVEGTALNQVFKWAAEHIPGLKKMN